MLFSLFLGLGNANRFISFICEGDDNQTAKTINYWADEVKMCRNSFPKSFRYLKLVLWIGVLPCDSRHQLTSSLHGSETQHKKWKTYILTDVFHRERYQGQKITESRPEINLWLPGITTVLHLCYTHREGRGEKKKNSSEPTYEQHLFACDTQDPADEPSGRMRWHEEQRAGEQPEGSSSSPAYWKNLSSAGQIFPCPPTTNQVPPHTTAVLYFPTLLLRATMATAAMEILRVQSKNRSLQSSLFNAC